MVELLSTLTVLFVAVGLLVLVGSRISIPLVPLYLFAGLLVGPFVDETQLLELAQWGIAFLVFFFGVEVEPRGLRSVVGDGSVIALLQVGVVGSLGFGLGLLFDFSATEAVVFGVAAGVSSSLVGLGHLTPQHEPRRPYERISEAAHFVQDVIAVLLILVMSAVLYGEGSTGVLAGIGLLVAGVVARLFVFDALVSFAEGDQEVMMLIGVSFIIGFIAVAEFVGISIIVAAFAAGIAMSREYPHNVETLAQLSYLKDFFVPLFFVTVAALASGVSLTAVGYAVVLVLAAMLVNPLVAALGLLYRGYEIRTASRTAMSLNQVSEFALFLVIELFLLGVIRESLFDAVVLAAVVTMLLASVIRNQQDQLAGWIASRTPSIPSRFVREHETPPEGISGHVIVLGYGTLGRLVAERCQAADREVVVVEIDPARLAAARQAESTALFGDAMDDETWERARVDTAKLIISTIPDESISRFVSEVATGNDIDAIVRARSVATVTGLLAAGALFVIVAETLAAARFSEVVDEALEGDATRSELRRRAREKLDLVPEQPLSSDPGAAD